MPTLEEIKAFVHDLCAEGDVTIVFNLNITAGSDSQPGGQPADEPTLPRYHVDTGAKKNRLAKVRPEPNISLSEIALVGHGDLVVGTGRTYRDFTEIQDPLGWVETVYLRAV